MKKILSVLILIFASTCLLTACGENRETKNFDTLATEFITALYDQDYEKAQSYLEEDIKAVFTEEQMADMVDHTVISCGAFQQVTAVENYDLESYMELAGLSELDFAEDVKILVEAAGVEFANADMVFYVMFDAEKRTILNVDLYGETELPRVQDQKADSEEE